MNRQFRRACVIVAVMGMACPSRAGELRGRIIDAATGQAVAARLYIQGEDGQWRFARSGSPQGSVVEYRKQRQAGSIEMHTTVSAHPFVAELPAGRYTLTVERGKEYHTEQRTVDVGNEPAEITIPLRRWIDMSARGYYSGETHVHRSLDELPNVMLAEDLNVAFPLTHWVTESGVSPVKPDARGKVDAKLIEVDATHVIWPLNTEWEIFTVKGRQHTLGAVFALNQREAIDLGVPPVAPVAQRVRAQGALLDLDKHNWPWSIMLVPVMKMDLYELTNNHVWRTQFGFRQWYAEYAPAYMKVERDAEGLTERGWIDFGLQTYYALLNCGYRMRPTAGTASGVHPVPLGFGRVYVQMPEGFSYDEWVVGLNAGRSFVTTGPMLMATVKDGHVTGAAYSAMPLDRIEVIVNGRAAHTIAAGNEPTPEGGYRSLIDHRVAMRGTTWLAVRCFEARPDGRVRFAHTAPVYHDVAGQPLRPRRVEVQYLLQRVRDEMSRNEGVLAEDAMAEFRAAAAEIEKLLPTAEDD